MIRIPSVLAFALLACTTVPDGPPEVLYDRVACSHCGMMVSDPRFAAQLVTTDGELRVFDDPACLFQDMVAHPPAVARMWFHDSTAADERWIYWDRVAFVPTEGAPMDGGLGAVPMGTAGAIGVGEASARVLDGKP